MFKDVGKYEADGPGSAGASLSGEISRGLDIAKMFGVVGRGSTNLNSDG
jgi:hypothetical protein